MQNVCASCGISGISPVCEVGERCPFCGEVAAVVIAGRGFCESVQHFSDRAYEAVQAAQAPAAPVVEAKPAKARCPHYQTIREFAAVAREMGLSMADKDRARGAMGVYLGVKIQSRSELTAAQWNSAITGLRAGVLFW